jgi:hypothetical protein
VLEYYVLLRSLLRAKPHLRPCLVRCRHCRIFFLTHPGNRGRQDLGCPFGCREAHRRQGSQQRSQAYYRTERGREHKRQLNRQRSLISAQAQRAQRQSGSARHLGDRPHGGLVGYVRLGVSLIEGRWLSGEEVWDLLTRILRQRRLRRLRPIDYAVHRLNKSPP